MEQLREDFSIWGGSSWANAGAFHSGGFANNVGPCFLSIISSLSLWIPLPISASVSFFGEISEGMD